MQKTFARNDNKNRSKFKSHGFQKRGGFKRGFQKKGKGRKNFSGEKLDIETFIRQNKAESNKKIVKETEYTPTCKFSDFKIEKSLKNNIEKKGYKEPTPI